MPLGPKMGQPGGHRFYIGSYRDKHEKKILSETVCHRALIFGIKHHLVDSTKFVQIMPLVPKMGPPGGHMFYIGLYRENMKKSSCLKPQGLDIWDVASSSESLASLFKLCP